MTNIISGLELVMLKHKGITVLELLIGLSIMSGVSLYTMKMTEEVENAVSLYQDKANNIQEIREKLKHVQLDEINNQTLIDDVEGIISDGDLY
jgi:predicted nucleic acid-binding OB-fold protein